MSLPHDFAGLETPAAYPHPVQDITVVQTHISWIILTGDFTYKIKRPVALSFLDMRELERRHELCEEEVRLNRRLAPEIYLEVCPITGTGAAARLGGPGEPVEYAVRMRQFDRAGELDRLVAAHALRVEELVAFGVELARWHGSLPPLPDATSYDDPDTVAKLVVGNARDCADTLAKSDHGAHARSLCDSLHAYASSRHAALTGRARADRFRECHGDLHLSNLVRIGTRIVAFDCLEFERRFRCIDVADEVAFLHADLEASGSPDLAQHFLNAYLTRSGDFGLCGVLNWYAAHRALVMAKTAALRNLQATSDVSRYLATAEAALTRPRPLCIVMCGLSGSGKTWLASRLAPLLRAVHVRSDIERKRAAGLGSTESSNSRLGGGLYDETNTRRTYGRIEHCAQQALDGRCNVIVDATFLHEQQRARIRNLAATCNARFAIVQCMATTETLERRIRDRSKAGGDASEADVAVMESQRKTIEDFTSEERLGLLEANTADPHVLERVAAALSGLSGVTIPE